MKQITTTHHIIAYGCYGGTPDERAAGRMLGSPGRRRYGRCGEPIAVPPPPWR